MNEVLQDIQTLENAIINLVEGASDEKRMAINSLNSMIELKRMQVEQFEQEAHDEKIDDIKIMLQKSKLKKYLDDLRLTADIKKEN